MTTSAQDFAGSDLRYEHKPANASRISKGPTLEDYPDELILRLFISMDFLPSIIAFRKTSKRHYQIAQAHALWQHLLEITTASWPEIGISLDRTYNSYTASELETLVKDQVQLERVWTSGNPAPVRKEEIQHSSGKAHVSLLELVPGGRWLIQNDEDGSGRLLYHDLNTPRSEPRCLVEHKHAGDPIAINLAHDKAAHRLEFDMAVVFCHEGKCFSLTTEEDSQGGSKLLSIWRVSLDDDMTGLHAVLIQEIPVYGLQVPARSISLYNNLVCRASWGPISGENLTRALDVPKIHTYEWRSSDTKDVQLGTPPKEGFIVPLSELIVETGVLLLPDGRLLAVNESWVELHEAIELQEPGAQAPEGRNARSTPLWRYDFYPAMPNRRVGVSNLFVGPSSDGDGAPSVRCSLWNSSTIYILSCKADGASIPQVTEIMVGEEDSQDDFVLGRSRGVRIRSSPDKKVGFAALSLYQPGKQSEIRRLAGMKDGVPKVSIPYVTRQAPIAVDGHSAFQLLVFDEESCRIVGKIDTESEEESKLVVLYFL
ncbi:hypothetical protein FRB90_004134 [Tulasnella sp. 427]|nr:hypothetical protein FRB90_004134 [Tulasnella sp. 427]